MYQSFPDSEDGSVASSRPSVCIVTSELVGPFKNGGIGTAMTGLAQSLAQAGFPVTVLYTGSLWSSASSMEHWQREYSKIGIHIHWLTLADVAGTVGPLRNCGFDVPYLIYDFLRGRHFDVVHFNDCMGEGVYCLVMKRLGVFFQDTLLCVGLHGPSQWVIELNRTLPESPALSAANYAERLTARCADFLWSPSSYLLSWLEEKGFVLPQATYLQQYVMPTSSLFEAQHNRSDAALPTLPASRKPAEIVFFGRLEERKGLRIFCLALNRLNDFLTTSSVKVTFLGKPHLVGSVDARIFLLEQSQNWHFSWQIVDNLNQQEATRYLRTRSVLAVIASPADNSPCTIYEVLNDRIPFIACRTGGIPELISAEDRSKVLFQYSGKELAEKLRQGVEQGVSPARPAEIQDESRRKWIGAFHNWQKFLPQKSVLSGKLGKICVVIDGASHEDFGKSLACLSALENVTRIICIDRYGKCAMPEGTKIPLCLFDPLKDDVADLRDAIGDAPDEAVFFLRAGVTVEPSGFHKLLTALQHEKIDGLVPAARVSVEGIPVTLPSLGASPAFSFYHGVDFSGGLLMRTESLVRAVQGQQLIAEDNFFGLPDFAVANGLELWPYAEPILIHTREYATPPLASGAPERIAAYDRVSSTERYYIAAMGYAGVARRGPPSTLRREFGLWLTARRMGWAVKLGQNVIPRPILNAFFSKLQRPVRWVLKR